MTKIIELINATVDVDNGFEDAKNNIGQCDTNYL